MKPVRALARQIQWFASQSALDVRKIDRAAIERKLRVRLREWQSVLSRRPDRARQLLRKVLVSPILLTADGDVYRFAGEVEFGVLLGEVGLPTNLARPAGLNVRPPA